MILGFVMMMTIVELSQYVREVGSSKLLFSARTLK